MSIPSPDDQASRILKAYATDDQLALRQSIHDLYSVPRVNFPDWTLKHLKWAGNERILDLGSGQGAYFEEIRKRIGGRGELVAGDLSLGMARKARENTFAGRVINMNALALPFPRRTFDVVLANHMLFHVPDLDRTLREIKRVLKPTGSVLATTNSQYTLPELDQLMRRSLSLLGARNAEWKSSVLGFTLEEGAVKLGRHFFAVARYDLPGAFVFGTARPAIDYVNSMRTLREPQLPPNITWDDFMAVLGDQLQRIVDYFGELVFTKLSGLIVATDAGAFATDYVSRIITSRRNRADEDSKPTQPTGSGRIKRLPRRK